MDVGTFAEYLTTVLGFTVVLLIALGYFIYVLLKGLNSSSSTIIDPKPKQ
ncbi:hypothetical protein [Caryophanon tenue]|nr:hypothetical protein [Caryophanon tenue]